jgi:hypothetical protein
MWDEIGGEVKGRGAGGQRRMKMNVQLICVPRRGRIKGENMFDLSTSESFLLFVSKTTNPSYQLD